MLNICLKDPYNGYDKKNMKKFLTIKQVGKQYRFRHGLPIVGDREGLLLTKNQQVAENVTQNILNKLGEVPVVDLCCGVGGITIFLAQYLPHVYAVDINPLRLEAAKLNASTYKVLDRITFIKGDVLDEKVIKLLRQNGVKAAVADAEWRESADLPLTETTSDLTKTRPSVVTLHKAISTELTENIIMYLPAKARGDQLRSLGPCKVVEVVQEDRVKYLNAYFGDLIEDEEASRLEVTQFLDV